MDDALVGARDDTGWRYLGMCQPKCQRSMGKGSEKPEKKIMEERVGSGTLGQQFLMRVSEAVKIPGQQAP